MIIERAKQVLQIEAEAIQRLVDRINEDFVRGVELILACEGKVVVTGVGKSGIIGQKLASTLASTGTPAFFLHPTEGIHGDLGVQDSEVFFFKPPLLQEGDCQGIPHGQSDRRTGCGG